MKQLTGKQAQGFVSKFEKVFEGLPHLPKGIVDFLVSVAPWLAGLSGILGVYGGLTSLFFSQRMNMMWQYAQLVPGGWGGYFILMAIISLLTGVLYLVAFSPLKDKKINGWMLLFWANILGLVRAIAFLIFGYGGLVGTLIGVVIGFYVLFEIKKSYK